MAHGSHSHHHPHTHGSSHSHSHSSNASGNLGVAFWLNLSFALVELAGGWWTGSLAVMSDALHDFGDALSFGVGYVLQLKSEKGPTENYSYGMRRLSLLSALISGLVISMGAIGIAIEAIRSFGEATSPHGPGMMGLAVLGIAVNGFAAWKMKLGLSHNEKMLRWHLIEDILGWVAVLIGGAFIWAFSWNWMDPFLALGISIFVLYNVLRNLSSTSSLFLQASPDPEGLRNFRTQVEALPHLVELHDVHFWSLDGVHHILSMHAVLSDLTQAESLKGQIREFSRTLGECHVTVEIEGFGEACHNDCEHEPS